MFSHLVRFLGSGFVQLINFQYNIVDLGKYFIGNKLIDSDGYCKVFSVWNSIIQTNFLKREENSK